MEYSFTATLNLNDNVFDLTQLQATVPDPTTGDPVEIAHANIHTCTHTSTCDIFRTGSSRKISTQETSNFSDDTATFLQDISYSTTTEYNVFAHIILPTSTPDNSSYHFMTFMTTTISSASSSSNSDSSSSSVSTGLMIALITVGVILLVLASLAVVFCRRKRRRSLGDDLFRHSDGGGFMNSNTTKNNNSKLDWSNNKSADQVPEFQWKDHYQPSFQSDYPPPPGLSASALAFHDRTSKAPKTISSSGSHQRTSSIDYDNYDNYAGAGGGNGGYGSPTGTVSTIQFPQRGGGPGAQYPPGHPMDIAYGHPDVDTLEYMPIGHSMENESIMGASMGVDAHNVPPYAEGRQFRPQADRTSKYMGAVPPYGQPIRSGGGFVRESDMSSLNDYEYDQGRNGTMASMSERMSDMSMATVDFSMSHDAPAVQRRQMMAPPPPPPLSPPPRDEGSLTSTEFQASMMRSTNGGYESTSYRGSEFSDLDGSYVQPAPAANRAGRAASAISEGESYEF